MGTGGDVTNLGEIVAERGNITLAGLLLQQQGVLSATTSVDEAGSIRLAAQDTAFLDPILGLTARNGGELQVAANSSTRVTPDPGSAVAIDGQGQNLSRIELLGRAISIGSNAQVVATGWGVGGDSCCQSVKSVAE